MSTEGIFLSQYGEMILICAGVPGAVLIVLILVIKIFIVWSEKGASMNCEVQYLKGNGPEDLKVFFDPSFKYLIEENASNKKVVKSRNMIAKPAKSKRKIEVLGRGKLWQ